MDLSPLENSSSQLPTLTPPTKQLALPCSNASITFEAVANLAWVNILWDKSVGVLCLTEESLAQWTGWLERFPDELPAFDLLDLDQATLADWQKFLSGQAYDLVILHGAYIDLQAGRLSIRYLAGLIDAVPAGVVVVA